MRIKWYGHACFRLEGDGISVVTDPYSPESAGLAAVPDPADFVVMSSALDEAHSWWQQVPGHPQVINALDAVAQPVALTDEVSVWAVAASEGQDRPDDPKANAVYALTIGGVTVCHMGDAGTPMTAAQLAPFAGKVDVLLALAGANLTIALPDLDEVIAAVDPTVVIPMHYWTPSINYRVGSVDDFLVRRAGDSIERTGASVIDIEAGQLPGKRTIVVLDPALDRALIA